MKTLADTTPQEDPLGYQRFALTESAYDLINSLTGIYARLRFVERQKPEPDSTLISQWQQRTSELQAFYQQGNWSDLPALERLIAELATEYRQHSPVEQNHLLNASNPRPTTIYTP